ERAWSLFARRRADEVRFSVLLSPRLRSPGRGEQFGLMLGGPSVRSHRLSSCSFSPSSNPGGVGMKTLPSADQALTNQSKPGSEKEPSNIQRRTLIGGALVALLSSPGRVMAQGKGEDHRREGHSVPEDPFVVLLNGLYRPVLVGSGTVCALHRGGV